MGEELFPRLFQFYGVPTVETLLSLNGFHDFCDKEGNLVGILDVLLQRANHDTKHGFKVYLLLPPVTSSTWYHYTTLPFFDEPEDLRNYFCQQNVKLVGPNHDRYMDVSNIAPLSDDLDDLYGSLNGFFTGPNYIRLTGTSERIKLSTAAQTLGECLVNLVK